MNITSDEVRVIIDTIQARNDAALKAARINAAIAATNAELEGMKAANEDRRQNSHAMAYDAAAFDAVAANLAKRVEEIIG